MTQRLLPRRHFLCQTLRLAGATPLALSGLAALGGCAESASLKAPIKPYTETVKALLISRDGKHLVFIGRSYHYVLDAPAQLVASLASPLHQSMDGEISQLHVDAENGISGHYQLSLAGPLDEQQAQAARELGFSPAADGGPWRASGELKGQRFLQGAFREGRQLEPLNKSYTVEISVDQSRGSAMADSLATPLTVGSDGILLVYFAVLAPILIPLAIITREPRP